ncbi:MAG TPA: HAMP domain-containing sensor histidine kinase [Thermoanaerobaculia bacterium]|nr:HAMP domain-containing sensor histidine kinase [Thermoanaerobaculia bacterium]
MKMISPRAWFRGWSLRTKFVLAITLLVAFVLLANGVVLSLEGSHRLREAIESRDRAFSTLAVTPICSGFVLYHDSGFLKFREILFRTVALNEDLLAVRVYDTSGRMLFDSRTVDLGRRDALDARGGAISHSAFLRALRSLDPTAWRTGDRRQHPLLIVVQPYIEAWGRHHLSAEFVYGYGSLRAGIHGIAWQLFWLSLGSLVLGGLFALLLARQSLAPLDRLAAGARALATGDLDHRIRLDTGDEFEVLADAFDRMAERLSHSIEGLEASNRALQEMDHRKNDLLANVGHELRTPLTAIRGYAEALSEGMLGSLTETQIKTFAAIERNAERLLAMIERMFRFAKLQQGDLRPHFQPFDLIDAAHQALAIVQLSVNDGPRLEEELGESLPPVWGDPDLIVQVLENLLTNALKFTPPEGRVMLRLLQTGEEVTVVVEDTGIGIAASERAKIFERYYQVDSSTRRKYSGMGLGLAIVFEILASHGRAVVVDSKEGQGTTFRFSLPLANAAGDAAVGVGT